MTLYFDFSLVSSFAKTQDFGVCAPNQARKARPLAIIIARSPITGTDGTVSPDFDCRSISPVSDSPVSDCPQLPPSEDAARSTIVGFGRKRHSVLPTVHPCVDDSARSTIVGFGRKQYDITQSITFAPSPLANADRKRQNRWSMPNPIIPRDPVDARHRRRFSLDLSTTCTPVLVADTDARRASVLGAARKVSDTILGNTTREPPKPLLLPQLVEARVSFPDRVKRRLVAQVAFVASSPRVKFLVSRFFAVGELRLKPLNAGRRVSYRMKDGKIKETNTLWCLIQLLRFLVFQRLCEIMGL